MNTATETKTFTLDKITGEFTIEHCSPRIHNSTGLDIGKISWSEPIRINGKEYSAGSAAIVYDFYTYKKRGFFVSLPGLYSEYTESARERLHEGFTAAANAPGAFTVPTVDDVNAEVLEAAYRAGVSLGECYEWARVDGLARVIGHWKSAYNAIFGEQNNAPMSLPNWPGVVSDLEVKAEFLAAAKAEITKQLESVESRLNA